MSRRFVVNEVSEPSQSNGCSSYLMLIGAIWLLFRM